MLIVLLTGTIHPQTNSFLANSDARIREHQYRLSLIRWARAAQRHNFQVVMAENSLTNLEHIRPDGESGRALELMTVEPPTHDESLRGKGACEGSIIRQALKRMNPASGDVIAKVTGRLFVRNFPRCLPRLDPTVRAVVDIPRDKRNWVDSRVFAATASAWSSEFSQLGHTTDDRIGRNFEHELAQLSLPDSMPASGVRNFAEKPWIVGYSGTTGKPYGLSITSAIRHTAFIPADRLRRLLTL